MKATIDVPGIFLVIPLTILIGFFAIILALVL